MVCRTFLTAVRLLTKMVMIQIKSFLVSCFDKALALLPKQKKVVFVNFFGRGYGDNPKYIAEEIIRQSLPYKLVWLVNDMQSFFPKKIKKVKYYSLKCRYNLATARVIVSNAKGKLPYIKSKSQFYIQTWHGGFPLKYIEKEAESELSVEYVQESKFDSSITDLILSGSDFQTKIIQDSFWYNGEIFKKGIPRNDIFFNSTIESINNLKKDYGFTETHKIVLYAPTFRDDNNTEAYQLDVNGLLEALREKTNDTWKLVIRLHPIAESQSSIFEYNENVINGSKYGDPQDLLLISDLLITDYSSTMMDFGIMGKPVLLFAKDLENYVSRCRGLRPIFYQLPFELCKTNEELQSKVMNFDYNDYNNKLTQFLKDQYMSYDDGNASKSVVERIKEYMG